MGTKSHWATKKSDSVQSRFQDPVQCLGMAWSKPTSIVDGLEQASMPPTDMIDYDNYDMDWTVVQPILLTRLPPRTPKTWGLFTRVSLARTKISVKESME